MKKSRVRKIFRPLYVAIALGFSMSVVALAAGISGVDVKDVAGYITTAKGTTKVVLQNNTLDAVPSTVELSEEGAWGLDMSPNKKFIAITTGAFEPRTKIIDRSGRDVTPYVPGTFRSWAPDSSQVFVYLFYEEKSNERKVYSLSVDGSYRDIGLPAGTTDAIMLPDLKTFVFTQARPGEGKEAIKSFDGSTEQVLVPSDGKSDIVLSSLSRDGKNLVFMRSGVKVGITKTPNELWAIGTDGMKAWKITDSVVWGQIVSWSKEGDRFLFARYDSTTSDDYIVDNEIISNIWEYTMSNGTSKPVTNFVGKKVYQPHYTAEGKVTFVSNQSGSDELWVKDGVRVTKLQTSSGDKSMPLID